jgi:hypothetical protein
VTGADAADAAGTAPADTARAGAADAAGTARAGAADAAGTARADAADAAVEWARGALAAAGRDVVAVDEVHHRAWSTVWRMTLDDGASVFCKTAPGGVSVEPALLEVLARHDVPHVQHPLAVSGRHVLLPDGGPVVRDDPDRITSWTTALAHYAELQRASAPLADELVDAGVPDLRLAVLPDVAAEVVARWAPERTSALPALRAAAAELAEITDVIGVPAATVEHSDLHDGNAFIRGAVPFDWGDACVSHPFCSLLVAGDEDVPGAVDAYLTTWTGRDGAADGSDVRRAVDLAAHLAIIPRALSWQRAIDAAGEDMPPDHREAARAWLLRLDEHPPAG